MTARMDETYAAALRAGLVARVADDHRTARASTRRHRWFAGTGAALAIGVAGGGIAYATGTISLPGSDEVSHLATTVNVTGDGTQTVHLGNRPAAASAVDIRLTCLTAGTFRTPDGAGISCASSDVGTRGATGAWTVPISAGTAPVITISTSDGARWHLSATYSTVTTTGWSVNAHGQTYGVQNQHGVPDLIAAIATNGRAGYVYSAELQHAEGTPTTPAQAIAGNNRRPSTITVYQSDGHTPIGTFIVG